MEGPLWDVPRRRSISRIWTNFPVGTPAKLLAAPAAACEERLRAEQLAEQNDNSCSEATARAVAATTIDGVSLGAIIVGGGMVVRGLWTLALGTATTRTAVANYGSGFLTYSEFQTSYSGARATMEGSSLFVGGGGAVAVGGYSAGTGQAGGSPIPGVNAWNAWTAAFHCGQ